MQAPRRVRKRQASVVLPPVISQAQFAPADLGRVVALVTAVNQATFAFGPATFGLLREFLSVPAALGIVPAALQLAMILTWRLSGGRA